MNNKLSKLLDIASEIVPAIGVLVTGDKSGNLAESVVEILKKVVKEEDVAKAKTAIDADPKVKAELKKRLAELAEQKVEEENRFLEEKRSRELDEAKGSLEKLEQEHKRQLELLKKDLQNTEAARVFARKSALSGGLTSWINPLLSIIISAAFLFFVFYIAANSLEGNDSNRKEVFLVAFGALATAFVTVISFHFGSSSGSKRKTKLQRMYGSEGTISSVPTNRSGDILTGESDAGDRGRNTPSQSTDHPFEAFWNQKLSHIKFFNWEELLVKGASNAQYNSNTDPDPSLYNNAVALVTALDKIREEIGAPVKLVSVYRSPAYNSDIGGARSSRHMQFDAADFVALGSEAGNSDRWYKIAKKVRASGVFTGGIGAYSNFVHIDTRGINDQRLGNADWDNR